jgi:hypothetical protein
MWAPIYVIPSWVMKFCGDGYLKNAQLLIRVISLRNGDGH